MDAFNANMEQLINDCNDTETLRNFANHWGLQDSPVVRFRLFQLEQQGHDFVEEQLNALMASMDATDVPTVVPPTCGDDLELAFKYVQEQDEIEETVRSYLFDEASMSPSPQPGPSNQQG
jgi:hypothetical protein